MVSYQEAETKVSTQERFLLQLWATGWVRNFAADNLDRTKETVSSLTLLQGSTIPITMDVTVGTLSMIHPPRHLQHLGVPLAVTHALDLAVTLSIT